MENRKTFLELLNDDIVEKINSSKELIEVIGGINNFVCINGNCPEVNSTCPTNRVQCTSCHNSAGNCIPCLNVGNCPGCKNDQSCQALNFIYTACSGL